MFAPNAVAVLAATEGSSLVNEEPPLSCRTGDQPRALAVHLVYQK